MANPEHLAILKQGNEAWNEWRKKKPDIRPDLSSANLSCAFLLKLDFENSDLSNANFFRTHLGMTNLNSANLSSAFLIEAHLREANLTNSNLREANLKDADLQDVNLGSANLSGADLRGANFTNTNLRGASFLKSVFGSTILGSVDLSEAVDLESIVHAGPSTIGIDTIYISRGHLTEKFLRGAGVPANFIEYISSLVNADAPIQYYSCFISYSSKNQDFADRLYAALQNNNVRCWLATEDLKIGDKFRTRIEESIRMHDKLLLVLSETSVNSPWVESEVESAMEREQRENRLVLFPVRLDDAVMDTNVAWAAEIRRTRHIGDFRNWKNHDSYQKAFKRLLSDLNTENPAKANDK